MMDVSQAIKAAEQLNALLDGQQVDNPMQEALTCEQVLLYSVSLNLLAADNPKAEFAKVPEYNKTKIREISKAIKSHLKQAIDS